MAEASEQAFNTARDLFTISLMYVKAVGEEIGMERALDILGKSSEAWGIQAAKAAKEMGLRGDDARAAGWVVGKLLLGSWGVASRPLEVSPQKIVAENGRCPVYDASVMAGINPKSVCRSLTKSPDAIFKEINPDLSQQCLKFRSSPDDTCIEAIAMNEPFMFPD